MSVWKSYRNYEILVWTLLDNYITTLKSGDPVILSLEGGDQSPLILNSMDSGADWPQTRMLGLILNGSMTLNVDGTMQLSFDIPMYLYINGLRVENPNWYNTINDNILVSMRKIKVIFNKFQTIRELDLEKELTNSVFEFIILKVLENHESDNLICHIECEGLAFHELGKIGYKLSLTTEEYLNDYYEWSIKEVGVDYPDEETKKLNEPKHNLLYWLSKAKIDPKPIMPELDENGKHVVYFEWYNDNITANKWYYEIRMAHTSLVHELEVLSNLIWEEGFPVDWTDDGQPLNYMEARERMRLVDINESNLYNITLDLAEKFEVFCKYEYAYDYNYNIIGRTIVFYNNFLKEDEGVETLMYPNSASKISREMDSTNISTKMFVRSVENADVYSGYVNIMDCSANKSKEDYLMNFDYLHDIGTISEELYATIPKYELKMKQLNELIIPLQNAWSNLSELKTTVDAKVTTLTNSIELDEERITENLALIYAIDAADGDADGFITRDYRNPETLTLMKDSSNGNYDTYYVLLNSNDLTKGILPETLELYKTYNTTSISVSKYAIAYSPIGKGAASRWNNTVNAILLPLPQEPSPWRDYRLTYKGTIGAENDKPDTKVLPTEPKLGWVYYVISDDCPNTGNKKGDLFICTNAENISWEVLSAPLDYDEKKGIFLYELLHEKLMAGPTLETVTCARYHSTSAATYVNKIRRLYYATTSNTPPSAPTEESAVTEETPIEKTNVFDKWTSVMPVPENLDTLSNYNYYTTWEVTLSSTVKKYTNVNHYDGDEINDTIGVTIGTSATNAPEHFLQDKVEQGTYVYDEYGNLDLVNGLFKSAKSGSYFYYKLLEKNNAYKMNNSLDGYNYINNLTTTLLSSVTDTLMPGGKADNYVIIKLRLHCTNGNVIYFYRFKYYNANEVFTAPEDGTTIKEIVPIFFLSTDGTLPPKPNSNNHSLTVISAKLNNVWTTVLPDKTKSSWKYYSGWCVTPYVGASKYYVPLSNGEVAEDTSLKKVKPTNVEDEENTIPKYLYAIYKYKPSLYYEKIIDSWILKKYEDSLALLEATEKLAILENLIKEIKEKIDILLEEKNTAIAKFEYMMGAALRESYWQPEDEYLNYGSRNKEKIKLFFNKTYSDLHSGTFLYNRTEKLCAKFGWDGIVLKEEDKLYYESSINLTRVYYPCINLLALALNLWNNQSNVDTPFLTLYREWANSEDKTNPFSFFFNPTKNEIALNRIVTSNDEGIDPHDIRYNLYYTIGSRAKLAFMRVKNDNLLDATAPEHSVIPVLLLTDATNLSDAELLNLYENGCVGQFYIEEKDGNLILAIKKKKCFSVKDNSAWMNVSYSGNSWIPNPNMQNYEIVYPRIVIPSLKLKNNDKDLVVLINDKKLTMYEDYYVLVKTYFDDTLFKSEFRNFYDNKTLYKVDRYIDLEEIGSFTLTLNTEDIINAYTITIKPEYLFSNCDLVPGANGTNSISLDLYYAISNADLSIYLDGKKILKENAYPKVAYDIEVSRWSPKLLNQLHTKLALIVMINDVDLKFENTFGYISEVKLDLDHEEKDTVEVKNYKTKFEDLFSKIVAETEEMHKNSYNIGAAGALVSGGSVDVTLNSDGFADTLADPTNQEILQDFLNNYFDGPNVVQQTLQDMWNEAGLILASAATSLNAVMSATTQNASILAGFRENVAAALTPNIYTGATLPTTFKPGDIWYNPDNETYAVATGYSGRGGFTRTHDGALALITGASMDIDADTGKIDILAETQINLMSGKNVYIAAGDTVDIVGNKAVNIGGTTINMASMNIIGGDYQGEVGGGGIHLVATDYLYNSTTEELDEVGEASGTSRVDVMGTGIELASKYGIVIKSGEGIKIYASNESDSQAAIDADHGTAAVTINSTEGIWLGSNKSLKLYSGDVVLNDDGTVRSGSVGANVELTPGHLLLGVANVSAGEATAIELSTSLIVLAAGSELKNLPKNSDGTVLIDKLAEANVNIAGVLIKSNYIGMATGTNTENNDHTWNINRSLISMEPGMVKLGQMRLVDTIHADQPESYDGSYLWLADNEIYIGGTGNFTLNTNNIKVLTKLLQNNVSTNIDSNVTNPNTIVSTLGFALGHNLLGLNNTIPDVGLGFWIDKLGGKHLVIDATKIMLGGDNVSSDAVIYSGLPCETLVLYKVTNSSTTAPAAPTINNNTYIWGSITSVTYEANATSPFINAGWSLGFQAPDNCENGTNYYVWSITLFKYKTTDGKYKFLATTPRREELTDSLVYKSYREYKYFNSELNTTALLTAALELTTGWTISIPTRETILNVWYYGSHACRNIGNITSNITLSDNSGTNYDIRQILGTDIEIITANGKVIGLNNEWMIKYKGTWIKLTANSLSRAATNLILYSRLHVVNNDGTSYNKDLLNENSLASLSAAAIDALNLASGAYPVPAVASSGLVVDGDNVLLGSTGKLMLLGSAEVFVGTSSSNSAFILNLNGISIGTGGDLGIASGGSINILAGWTANGLTDTGTITINSPNFTVKSNPSINEDYFYVGEAGNSPFNYMRYRRTSSNAAELLVKGAITATSFILDANSNGYTITYNYLFSTSDSEVPSTWLLVTPSTTYPNPSTSGLTGKYLWIKTTTTVGGISTDQYNISYVADNGQTQTMIIDYAVSTTSTSIPSSNSFSTDYSTIVAQWNATNKFLFTRTRKYFNGTWNYEYTISRYSTDGLNGLNGTNGTNGAYITSIKSLYNLWKNEGLPPQPQQNITSESHAANGWRIIVPDWQSGGTYYRCELQEWSGRTDGVSRTWTDVYADYGLTTANLNAFTALTNASAASAAVTQFTTNGLVLDETWNNTVYKVALMSTTNLLIGANSGITIAKPTVNGLTGAALVLDSSGIAMNAANISLVASGNNTATLQLISDPSLTYGGTSRTYAGIYMASGSNSITMNNNDGLVLTGSRITINGDPVWARDDIIVMNPNATGTDSWRATVAKIETHMNGAHDWVLIRPYYDALIIYNGSCTEGTVSELTQAGGEKSSFGNGASWFEYSIEGDISRATSTTSDGVTNTIQLSTTSTFDSGTVVTFTIVSDVHGTPNHVSAGPQRLTGTSKVNLCLDNGHIYIKVTNSATATTYFSNIKLTCKCSATNSRVPCTVYYYP